MNFRIGSGYDVHRLTEGRRLVLCGVEIPHTVGLLGNSDADVAAHAAMDAMLGAVACGDIGKHFPDKGLEYKDADSMVLMKKVSEILRDKGYAVSNIDITIIAQAPKLAPYIEKMRENVAMTLGIDVDLVSVKATTEEGLGFTGEKLGIASQAICLVTKI